MQTPPDISVVIPAWNERENLAILLPSLQQELQQLGLNSEIIISDGGSIDGSQEFAREAGAQVVLQTERGYGGAASP